MRSNSSAQRYHLTSVSLHWLMLLVFVGTYATIELRVLFEKGTPNRDFMKNLHFMSGLLVFFLVWLRLAMRAMFDAPEKDPSVSPFERVASQWVHAFLYLFMVGMPLLGWLVLSAAGKPIPFFGLEFPALIEANKELAGQIKEVHETVGVSGYFVIGGHALAALFHHYVRRDGTLQRMLP